MNIETRLEVLEKELNRTRRLNRFLVGFFLLAVAIGSVGAKSLSSTKDIRANKIIIEDVNGKPRILLAVAAGSPTLALFDEKGNPGARLYLDNNGKASLGFINDKGKPQIGIGLSQYGPGLSLFDENGAPRVVLSLDGDKAGIGLLDKNGKSFWQTPQEPAP
jgi:hypothetical protein